MGHYIQARRNGVYATLPFFIPIPSLIGTMGAVIFMEPRMGHRRALFDIGITGPLAGLAPTLVCCVLGIYWSQPASNILGNIGDTHLGVPLLFKLLIHWMGKGENIMLHPVAFAGWVGLLITCLNLIPIGQLDGGHILYALLRKKAYFISRFLLASAALCVIVFGVWYNGLYVWTLMIVLLVLMGPTHPPTADDDEPLGWGRTVLGWLTLAFIPLGFTPFPFNF
jgi:membrane-associated protease RseP (regulator of RpoE activity)